MPGQMTGAWAHEGVEGVVCLGESNKYITFEMKYSEFLRVLKREGWVEVRQRGSHKIMKHENHKDILSFPYHGSKEMPLGLLIGLLKKAGLKK